MMLGSARRACRTSRAASASRKVIAAVLFLARTSARTSRSRAIVVLVPQKSKRPSGREIATVLIHAIAMNRPVSLWRIDQSRIAFMARTSCLLLNYKFGHAQQPGTNMKSGLRGCLVIHLQLDPIIL